MGKCPQLLLISLVALAGVFFAAVYPALTLSSYLHAHTLPFTPLYPLALSSSSVAALMLRGAHVQTRSHTHAWIKTRAHVAYRFLTCPELAASYSPIMC